MHRTLTCLLGIGICSIGASGEPQVLRFDQDTHFDPFSDSIDLLALDATAPDIRLAYFADDPGGGSNAEVWHPEIIGVGWSPFGGIGLEVETSIDSGVYLLAGGTVPAATPGPWGVAERIVFWGFGPDNYPLERIAYEVFPLYDTCLMCSYVEDFLSLVPGTKYVALRWDDGGVTYYGWAAFRLEFIDYPDNCWIPDKFSCTKDDVADRKLLGLRYLAAGWETEADTPIVVGAGLCPADLNFDARVNFFDISEFITLYNSGDPAADLDPNGVLNFFDVAAYIGLYNEPCD